MLLYFTFKLYMHMPTYIFHTRCLCHNFILFTILQFHYSSGFTWAYVHQIHVGPPFPILFNLMVDVFWKILYKDNTNGLIKGICLKFVLTGITQLSMPMIHIFIENESRIAVIVKWILIFL
jgi:hypothetical protein